jgi:deoxyribodipyrimidine photo-lyase
MSRTTWSVVYLSSRILNMTTTIWWIRRDLRLKDNVALQAALAGATAVYPLYILDPTLWQSDYVGPKRLAFLLDGLRALDGQLRQRGSRLVVRHGHPEAVLPRFLAETGATRVVYEVDYSRYAKKRDARLARLLPLHCVGTPAIRPPGEIMKKDGMPYTVFTPFSRTWKALPLPQRGDLLPAPNHIPTPRNLASDPFPNTPTLPATVLFAAGEVEAQRRLSLFLATGITGYANNRDMIGLSATSGLSPYLRLGMVSGRETAVCARDGIAETIAQDPATRAGAESWLNELIWRDFYIHILHHFPHVSRGSFRPQWNAIPWRNDPSEFTAWCVGETGYPVVDAAMRQLNTTGWMHNRARMIVASFLVKDLLIDWRWGEKYFMQQLIDGDPAANNGGWQWAAGTGTDAAPYFRIFNPVSQGKKFDPNGVYVRRWLPELANVPLAYLHEPWVMPSLIQRSSGVRLGETYPRPIVDHQKARKRTLAAYAQAKT